MSVAVRKLFGLCVRTSLVATIAASAVLPAASSAEGQAGKAAQVEEQANNDCKPLLDKDGRPLPGNVTTKKAPPPPCPPGAGAQARTAAR